MNTNDKYLNCSDAKGRLINWMNVDLSAADQSALDAHLAQCPACQQEFSANRQLWQRMGAILTPAPGPAMRTQFYAMLDTFEATEKIAKTRRLASGLAWLQQHLKPGLAVRMAYSVLLVGIGIGAGYWLPRKQEPAQTYQLRIDTLSVQVQEMREMMMLSLLENPSATERLRAVGYTEDITQVNEQVVEALLTTLNNDDNVNVRLVTLEALAKLADQANVREGLVQSITRQESPLVQSALADVMVKLQEKRSIKPLQQLLHDDKLNYLVKGKIEKTIKDLS